MSVQRRIWQLTLLMGLVISMTIAPPIKADPDPDTMHYNAGELHRFLSEGKRRAAVERKIADQMLMQRDLECTQTNYDVRFYNVAIRVDDTTETLWGCVTFIAEATEPDVSEIQVDLADNMPVDSIVAPSGPLSCTRDGDVVVVTLDAAYGTGEQFEFDFYYHGHPRSDDTPFGGFAFHMRLVNEGPTTKPVISSVSQPYGSRTWWPCKDRPDDKADSMKAAITVNSWFYVASNGDLDSIVTPIGQGSIRVYHYSEDYPIASYLFNITMTDYWLMEEYWYYNDGQDSMLVTNAVYPEQYALAEPHYEHALFGLTYFSQAYGLYPFIEHKYGHADFEWGVGMEHQTQSSMWAGHMYEGFWRDFVIHELAHQWWGDMITCKSWGHIWLNEGWATYSEALHLQLRWGWTAYHSYIASYYAIEGGPVFRPDTTDPNVIFDLVVYERGAWVCHMLRRVVGDSLFFVALDEYAHSEFRFGSATTEDFCMVWERATGMELSWFFDNWIYGTYRPHYRHAFMNEEAAGGGYNVFMIVDQVHTTDPEVFGMPVDFVFHTAGGAIDTLQLWCDNRRNTFVLHFDDSVVSYEVDPSDWMLEYNAPTGFNMQFVIEEDLPVASKDVPYSFLLDLRGDGDWNTFAVTEGSLPSGFGLDSIGYVNGVTSDTGWFEFTARVDDNWGSNYDIGEFYLYVSPTSQVPGDADQSGQVDIGDLVYLAMYMFQDGPAPLDMDLVDVDASCALDIADLVYLVMYMFQDGPALQMGCVEG